MSRGYYRVWNRDLDGKNPELVFDHDNELRATHAFENEVSRLQSMVNYGDCDPCVVTLEDEWGVTYEKFEVKPKSRVLLWLIMEWAGVRGKWKRFWQRLGFGRL